MEASPRIQSFRATRLSAFMMISSCSAGFHVWFVGGLSGLAALAGSAVFAGKKVCHLVIHSFDPTYCWV